MGLPFYFVIKNVSLRLRELRKEKVSLPIHMHNPLLLLIESKNEIYLDFIKQIFPFSGKENF